MCSPVRVFHRAPGRFMRTAMRLLQVASTAPLPIGNPGAPAGRRVAGQARSIDILPTVLDYLDLSPGGPLTGESLRPWIEGGTPSPRIAYAEMLNGYENRPHIVKSRPQADFLYVVSDGEWKLLYRPTRPAESELYHLASDPGELTNRFETERDEALRLLVELGAREPWVTKPFGRDPADTDPTLTKAMMALGYAGGEATLVDPTWAFQCPENGAVDDAAGACEHCGRPKLLVARE